MEQVNNLWAQSLALQSECEAAGEHLSWRKVQRALGTSDNISRSLHFALRHKEMIAGQNENAPIDNPQIAKDFQTDKATITTKSINIKTLDDALVYAEVDLEVWEVERHIINPWTVTMGKQRTGTGKPETYTNYQIKVWLRRKAIDVQEAANQQLIERLIQERPARIAPRKKTKGDILAVPGLVDHHFGLLAWGKETGEGDYDLKIAERFYVDAINQGIDSLKSHEIAKFLLPVGSDFFHINSPDNSTPKNHNPLDVDSRLIKVFETGKYAVIKAVERMAEIAPVDIEWIPGNHDPEISYYLCEIIKAYFRGDKNVTVNTGPTMRKFAKWGQNLIGLTHGDEEPHKNLPTIMADSCPEWWGQCAHKEWLIGHIHKKKEMNFIGVDSFGGTIIRFLPSLCRIDQWHYRKGYVGGDKAMEIYAYDLQGLHGYFPIYQRGMN